MTANHEHTPTDEEMQEQFETGAMVTEFAHNRTDATIAWQLWLQERDARISAAAEQRGAEHHLRLAASELNMHHLTEDLSDDALELGVRFINLIQDRADRIANKENE